VRAHYKTCYSHRLPVARTRDFAGCEDSPSGQGRPEEFHGVMPHAEPQDRHLVFELLDLGEVGHLGFHMCFIRFGRFEGSPKCCLTRLAGGGAGGAMRGCVACEAREAPGERPAVGLH